MDTFNFRYKNPFLPSNEAYRSAWKASVENPEAFWASQAKMVPWMVPYERVWSRTSQDDFVGQWFVGGKLNAATVCVDRWAEQFPDEVAFVWRSESDSHGKYEERFYSYSELSKAVSQAANMLISLGARGGDRIGIWLPMIPELLITQFACAKIGAIPTVIFSGFSGTSVQDRVLDAQCTILVTADGGRRRGKTFSLRDMVPKECVQSAFLRTIVTVCVTREAFAVTEKDVLWEEAMAKASEQCPTEQMDAEAPLFLLYTSGTTGKPKGIVHSTAGYLIYAMSTMKYVWGARGLFGQQSQREVWFCTADVGWITGHSYLVYAPFALGVKVVMYEGVLTYPSPETFFDVIDRYQVTHLYTAPTLIRQLAVFGEEYSRSYELTSIQVLGSVGEPIDAEAWKWFATVVGRGKCPIVDTYWQTETGGYLLSPMAGVTPLKPCSCTFPCLGIRPRLVDDEGLDVPPGTKGHLCIAQTWPGMMRTVYGDHQRFVQSYLSVVPGHYATGDEARQDEDGYFWIVGRTDDVIKVSGHRLGSAELEQVVASFPGIAECAVVATPHAIKGSEIVAFVVGEADLDHDSLRKHVRGTFGPIAVPEKIVCLTDLPKTRSGKIMRRMLKNLLLGEEVGDVSTLVNPDSVREITQQLFLAKGLELSSHTKLPVANSDL